MSGVSTDAMVESFAMETAAPFYKRILDYQRRVFGEVIEYDCMVAYRALKRSRALSPGRMPPVPEPGITLV